MSLAREIGDKWRIASGIHDLAWVRLERGEYTRARAMYEECWWFSGNWETRSALLPHSTNWHWCSFYLSVIRSRVASLLEESLELWKEIGSQGGNALWSYLAGQLALQQGDAAQARLLLEESVTFYKEMGDRWHSARSLFGLARVEAIQGNYTAARTLYKENLALCREMGIKNIAPALEGLAGANGGQGEPAWAAQLWGAAEIPTSSYGNTSSARIAC